jgi:hypothetical protein
MISLFLSVTLLTSFPPDVQAGAAKSPLIQGLERATDLLTAAKDVFNRTLVEPEARAQARRSLRRLANRLDALALAKEDFTAGLFDAAAGRSKPIHTSINELQQELREVRESLTSAFAPLPDEWKKRSGEVQRAIEQPLNDKAITLGEIAQQLRLPDASREQLIKESEMTIALVNKVRSLVDAIIAELSRPLSVTAK